MLGDRKKQFSAIQRKRRKGSLAESALDSEIRKILKRNLEQTWRDVKDKLERRVGLGVITEVSEDRIKYFVRADSDEEASLKISTLPNKVGAIRKSITKG
jgi:acetate kinase